MTESRGTVHFLGPLGSYTHQACSRNPRLRHYTLRPEVTIEDVFKAVQSDPTRRGVVPFENSTNGSVVFTLDLFADVQKKYQDIVVCGETYLPVLHCVVGHPVEDDGLELSRASQSSMPTPGNPHPQASRTKVLSGLGHITKLYSHPQAWGQCGEFLARYFKGVERIDMSSTSRAAQQVKEDVANGIFTTAAISSEMAAEIHGVQVLARGIQDRLGNSTRFFELGNKRARNGVSQSDEGSADQGEQFQRYKTLIAFTVEHTGSGALADALAVFKQHGINLTSINTRPSGTEPWHYIFFIEIQGRRMEDGTEGAVNRALVELDKAVKSWRWLGSWENTYDKEALR